MKRLIESQARVIKITNKIGVYMKPERDVNHHKVHMSLETPDYEIRIEIPRDVNQDCTTFKEDAYYTAKFDEKTLKKVIQFCNQHHQELLDMWNKNEPYAMADFSRKEH